MDCTKLNTVLHTSTELQLNTIVVCKKTGERERMQIPQFNSAQDRERLEKAWKKFLRQFRLIWPTFASCPGPWLLYFTLLLIWEIVSDNLKSKWEREETMGWPTFSILLFLYHITLSKTIIHCQKFKSPLPLGLLIDLVYSLHIVLVFFFLEWRAMALPGQEYIGPPPGDNLCRSSAN